MIYNRDCSLFLFLTKFVLKPFTLLASSHLAISKVHKQAEDSLTDLTKFRKLTVL